jgi:membrane protease YdiL (CAAX protease family)
LPDSGGPDVTAALGPRRPFSWQDVVLTCAVTAAIILLFILVILFAAANRIAPFSGNAMSTVSIALLLLEPAAIFAGIYFILIKRRGFGWADLGLRPLARGWITIALLAALGCLVLAGVVTQITDPFYESPMINEYAQVLIPGGLTLGRAIIVILCVGILVPAAEELLFRGLLYGWLRQRWTALPCTLISAGLFALAHANLRMALQIFITGAVLAVLYEYSRSIVAPMVTHMAVNTTSLVIIFAYAAPGGAVWMAP